MHFIGLVCFKLKHFLDIPVFFDDQGQLQVVPRGGTVAHRG